MLETRLDLSTCPALDASRDYSNALIQRAREALVATVADLEAVETIAVCGSLGRLEANPLLRGPSKGSVWERWWLSSQQPPGAFFWPKPFCLGNFLGADFTSPSPT